MRAGQKAIVWFDEVNKNDIPIVGGKGANLGELTNAGIPVPPGFIVTSAAYFSFVEQSGIRAQIEEKLSGLDPEDNAALQEASLQIKTLVSKATMPPEIAEAPRSWRPFRRPAPRSNRFLPFSLPCGPDPPRRTPQPQ